MEHPVAHDLGKTNLCNRYSKYLPFAKKKTLLNWHAICSEREGQTKKNDSANNTSSVLQNETIDNFVLQSTSVRDDLWAVKLSPDVPVLSAAFIS